MSESARFSPRRSGVYGIARGAAARRAAEAAGAAWFQADLATVTGKKDALRRIAAATGYPGTFGDNWDALADVLQDLSWRPAAAYVLHVTVAAPARAALGAEWQTLLEIVTQSAMYWKNRGKCFVVLIDDAGDLPPWT